MAVSFVLAWICVPMANCPAIVVFITFSFRLWHFFDCLTEVSFVG